MKTVNTLGKCLGWEFEASLSYIDLSPPKEIKLKGTLNVGKAAFCQLSTNSPRTRRQWLPYKGAHLPASTPELLFLLSILQCHLEAV